MKTSQRASKGLLAAAIALALPMTLFASPQAATEQPGAQSTSYQLHRKDEGITASITHIDKSGRFITLRGPKGKEVTIQAGPKVKNFDQLKVGDQVKATYQAALAFELLPADSATAGEQTSQQSTTAAPGDKPGMEGEQSITVTAKLTAVDMKKHTVTLTGADGNSRVIEVKDPAKQARMGALKVGQMVRITYVEAVAVTVTPKAAAK